VGPAAAAASLTIVATGRDATGVQVAQDQVVVPVIAGLQARPHLLGVPVGRTGAFRLALPAPIATDLSVQLSLVDPTVATLPPSPIVLPAGQTEVVVPVTGLREGASTIAATSARGNTWVIASVSPAVAKQVTVEAGVVGVAVTPTRQLGQVFTSVNGQRTIALSLLSAPAAADTPVTITTTNAAVASVAGVVTIPQGGQTATAVITTGVAGVATLTFRAGNEVVQLTVVVGTPAPGSVPPILARPVSAVVLGAVAAGRVFAAPAGQAIFTVTLLSSPASVDTPVTVSSSDGSVASVTGPVIVPAGATTRSITVQTGSPGTATLTFRAGGEARQLTVVVGTPPADSVPLIVARPAGIVLLPASSIGRLFTSPAVSSTFTLQLLSSPAAADTVVTVITSDPTVVSVSGLVVIPAGAQTASLTIETGVAGTARLRFSAGGEVRELSIVVGTPPDGIVPPVVASPVGVAVVESRQLGAIFTPISGQATVGVTLLPSPAATPVTVNVTSSDAGVATVIGPVVIAIGGRSAAIEIVTGAQGVATLTLRAGGAVAQLLVVVGTPPPSRMPVITAPIVGVEIKE
jgi:hypothetical protein